ncbi:NADH-quinone oxidoreductase subunit NuoH [Occallatibacter riparius]|uniref:NADH-quinone oxidoreductase subunit H n=1 Tax=Occallatibacter riparius TaxID=1002689 RepID=A0A9J7BP32_9BACT|nr:NADH-quinone oxidoreductase subunit NuoH [Occallatibacter riparius]UWZ82901.1 NADH-quinone oxidoreductase subunit NuoH [Occallatibacter riparius]
MTILQFVLWSILKVIVVTVVLLMGVAYTVLLERKLVGRIQNRWGPSRVGPFGLLQPLVDGAKNFLKEDIIPGTVYRPLYLLAPILSLGCAMISISVVPFGSPDIAKDGFRFFQIADVNIGLLVILGITSVGVYGIALAGWSSNNKYSLLGSLRSSAQLISYELALGLSLVGVVLRAGTLNLREIVESQARHGILSWNLFGGLQFIGFFIYLMAAYAETNRAPFDLPEAESELTAGYHTEYSSMKFAMFFMAEYANMITVGCVATLLFLGGWTSPLGDLIGPFQSTFANVVFPIFWFVLKVFSFLFLYVWVRGTLPRFRYDQLMNFGWRFLLPLAILNVIGTSLWFAFKQ